MSDDPKLNEWNLLREKFDAVVDEGARLELIGKGVAPPALQDMRASG